MVGRPGSLRIAVLAPSRFPIAEPFTGGLEAHVWLLAHTLRARGHEVSLFAAPGSDPGIAQHNFHYPSMNSAVVGRRDISGDPGLVADEHRAYLSVMTALAGELRGRFDVVHNNSLHYLPLALAHLVDAPFLTTLHTPPIRMMELARRASGDGPLARFAAVSQHTASSWRAAAGPMTVVHNGVDTDRWCPGPGGDSLIWFGRLVPEKGADVAMTVARDAGRRLDLVGPIIDRDYFEQAIRPGLGPDVRYLGHRPQTELAALVGAAGAVLVTPRWNEPYGMVVAEALACGTPVAAFSRGGIPEIITDDCGRLAPADDVAALVRAVHEALPLSRRAARRRAVEHCSVTAMIEQYEQIYGELIDAAADDLAAVPA